MQIARTFPFLLVAVLAAGGFAPAAHAQAPVSPRSGNMASMNLRPMQVAELNQRRQGKELSQRKYAGHQGKVRTADITGHKKHRAARKPTVNSILFRIAPYNLTMA
jgi:hypothetical protein